uniref:DAGKc domain-containing protein n=1 Tax=Gopherus evgoodei TaxID=1825980 RepID=A0A8C4Y5L8_9SAUR
MNLGDRAGQQRWVWGQVQAAEMGLEDRAGQRRWVWGQGHAAEMSLGDRAGQRRWVWGQGWAAEMGLEDRAGQRRWVWGQGCAAEMSLGDRAGQRRWVWGQGQGAKMGLVGRYRQQDRMGKLLVFVNPVGGRCRASEIYRDRVAGLFALAGIQTEVIVTPRSLAPRLVCVGGDGTFNELMHALISRTQRKAGIPEDNPTAPLLPPRLRIGIIPAGSTDCICFATVGTNDPVTSALHIIIGDSQPLDVCSVHHHERLLRYAVSLVGYGFYGDVVSDSERHRWMGPMRYDFSGFKAVLCNRSYEGTVEFLTVGGTEANPRDQTRCRAGETGTNGVSPPASEWQREQGRFLAINLTCMSSACPKSPDGLSPSAHLADGTADLILVRECSALGFLRHLSRHMDHRDQFDLPFVSVHRVRALRFTPKQLEDDDEGEQPGRRGWKGLLGGLCCGEQPLSSWSCDGETLPHADISVRVHRQLIHLFARGIEQGMGLL